MLVKNLNYLRFPNKLLFSSAPLRTFDFKPVVLAESTPTVIISAKSKSEANTEANTDRVDNNNNLLSKFQDHRFYALLQSKSIKTRDNLNSFARGPLRSNLLVSLEVLKIISAEQRWIPAWDSWPQAKSAYISRFEQVKAAWRDGRFTLENVKGLLEDVTWGDVGRSLRVTAEMVSFYYIGELLGMIISLPFK